MKKRTEKNIKAIVFDVGGVLALGENSTWDKHKIVPSGVHIDVAKKLKISLDQYLDAIDTNYALAIEGKISREKALEIFSKNLKISEGKLKKVYNQAFKLKKLGYKISVLSDQWYLSKDALMPKKFYKRFDSVIVSCEVKIRKPNPKIYELLLKRLKLKPSEILFIDNQLWNTKPANKLGMKTILFKDNNQLFENKTWKGLFNIKNKK